jgi:hypothetical protein
MVYLLKHLWSINCRFNNSKKKLDKNSSNDYGKVSLAVTVFSVPYNYWTVGYEPVCPEI